MGYLQKMNFNQLMRILHPSYMSLCLFFNNWGQFLWGELYQLILLFTAVYLLQQYFLFHKLRMWFYWLCILAARKFMAGGFCNADVRLNGYTIVITGADSGIGRAVAKELALLGAHLVLASRDPAKAQETKQELVAVKGSVEIRRCDLSSLASVRQFAQGLINHKYHIHMLVNVAGELMPPQQETTDGVEHQLAVNYLGHFLLTNMLLPWLTHDRPARIINVSSTAHLEGEIPFGDFNYKQRGYNKWQAYCNSKLATLLFTKHLVKKVKDTNIEVFCANPGVSESSLYRHVLPQRVTRLLGLLLMKTPQEAAQTVLHCAMEAKQEEHFYYSECRPGCTSDAAQDDALAARFWRESEKLVGSSR